MNAQAEPEAQVVQERAAMELAVDEASPALGPF